MQDFRSYLQEELVRRCKANSSYSLRAFARALKIDGSRLSKMLKGTRPIRPPMIESMGLQLGLSLEQIQEFSNKSNQKTQQNKYHQLSLDTFKIITDWRHYAIMELMKVEGFVPQAKWIAKRLGTTAAVVNSCIERLMRVRLLEIDSSGKWSDCSLGFRTHVLGDNITSHAHRMSQTEILKMAIQALREVPIEQRDQSSMMMATNRERMAEAKKRIKKFRRELCAYMEEAQKKDTILQLSVSLFPIG